MVFRSRQFALHALTSALVSLTSRAARAQSSEASSAPAESPPVSVVVSAALGGDFATLRCGSEQAAGIVDLSARLAGEPEAVAFDAGGFLGAAALSRLTVDRDARGLAEAAESMRLRAFVVDQDDLAMPRESLVRAAIAFGARGMSLVFGNVRCNPNAAPFCAAIHSDDDPPLLFDTPRGRVALVAAMSPTVAASISRDRVDGLTILDPSLSIGVATNAARAAGAQYVVAVYDPALGHELTDAITVAQGIPPRSSPDVMLVRRIDSLVRSLTVPDHATRIVAARDGEPLVFDLGSAPSPRPARSGPIPGAVRRFSERTEHWLCNEIHRPTEGAAVDAPVNVDGFASLILDVMREHTQTEVAIINRGGVDPRAPFPFAGRISPLDVAIALPFDNPLRVTRMTAAQLLAFLQSSAAQRFYIRGATLEDGAVRVNGRPTDDGVRYSVVTIDYVAEGGDGGIGTGLAFLPIGRDSLRDVFLAWLARPHRQPLVSAPLDPARRTLWVFRTALDTTFSSVVVNNPNRDVFTDTQLNRTPSTTGRLDLEMHADAFHPRYRLENGIRLLYGATISTPPGMLPTLIETADLITGRSTGVWRGLLSARRVWYRPRPYVDTYLESEFTRPTQRSYHHLELRPTVGLRFEASDRLSFNIGGGLSWEVFATPVDLTPPGNPAAPIFNIGYTLRPGNFFSIGTRHAEGESSLDVALRDPFGQIAAQIRFRARVAVPLFDPISLTLSYEMYARYNRYYDDEGFVRGDWALSNDVNLGIKVTFARALQAYLF